MTAMQTARVLILTGFITDSLCGGMSDSVVLQLGEELRVVLASAQIHLLDASIAIVASWMNLFFMILQQLLRKEGFLLIF